MALTARAAQDLGLAGLLGGNLFGRLALHPSVTEISDEAERGKVVNAAWRRYGTVNSISLAAVIAGWVGGRGEEAVDPGLARAKDALVAAVALTGLASAVQGMRFAAKAPGGAVPLADGDHVAARAGEDVRRAKRRLNVLGAAALAAEAGLVVVDSALAQQSLSRPPARRLLRR
jgi:uncharacterized membrane protein